MEHEGLIHDPVGVDPMASFNARGLLLILNWLSYFLN